VIERSPRVLTLFRDADVFDPSPLGHRDVLVCAGRVVAIERALEAPRGLPCAEVACEGRRLIPGLVDLHVHAGGGGGESGFASRVPPIVLSALSTAGVTTCVGVLGTDVVTRTMEDLVARTLGLREEGLSAYCWTGGYSVPPRTLTGSVRRDIVFVDPIVGAGEIAISDHRSSQPSFEELARLAADCHVAGLTSGKAGVLHLHLGDGTRGLELVRRALDETELPARVFHPTHVNRQPRLFEEAKELAKRGTTVDLTSFPVEDGDPALSAEDAIEAWLDAELPRARLTVSSDGAGCLPVFDAEGRLTTMDVGRPSTLLDTLRALLRRGRPMQDVLGFFTRSPADLLRLPQKGRIAAGADADLVLLDEEARPVHVMARGRDLVRESRPCARGMFEKALSEESLVEKPVVEKQGEPR
jgi:beta-aspartyl-dipeptidase (metallo-type)